ncbi:uncharacterized protein LOC135844651 isoform X2 [Planococcus citri]|uniref:uncharacterized protein LOC135844651 isoform X2 n=1 Tax=Planococcus citri TaxID=170843 RepID=UPI0031F74959
MSINQTLGENYDDESLKERYVFLYDLPSLQEISSYEVCRTIWYSNLSKYQLIKAEDTNVIHCRFMIGLHLFDHYQEHNEQLMKHLNVPASIEDILENSMNKVCTEIRNWVLDFYYGTLKLEDHCGIRLIDPKWWVWSINGEIDCSKSARRILKDVSLTEWQKFLVMCRYCMADEINKFSSDCLPSQFFTRHFHESNFICFYWICYLRNELHRIPVRNNDSVDWTISRYHAELEILKNVFWSRLNDDQRVTLVAYWINESVVRSTSDFICLEQIISKMSRSLQQRLLRKTSNTIVKFFASYSDSLRCTLWAWSHVGDQMTVEQFAELIEKLLKTNVTWKSTSLLDEIWSTASAHQRNHVIQTKLDKFMDLLLADGDSTFSDRFLQLISADERKKLIFRLPNREILLECDIDFLSSFLDLYLPNPDDQLTLKKLVIDSPAFVGHLKYLLKCMEYESFDEALEFYFSHDAAAAQIFKRDFLEQKLKTMDFFFDIKLITSTDTWDEFSRFIDEIFDDDPKPGLMVKQWFITSTFTGFTFWVSQGMLDLFPKLRRGFDDFVKIVEMVFKNDELKNVKRLFFDEFCSISIDPSCRTYFVYNFHNDIFFPKFMQWCSVHNGKPILKL